MRKNSHPTSVMIENIRRMVKEEIPFKEIASTLGCSITKVYYHSSPEQKKSWADRQNIKRYCSDHPFTKKLQHFVHKKYNTGRKQTKTLKTKLLSKLFRFLNIRKKGEHKVYEMIKAIIERLGANPRCYLTGELIDINDTTSYEFDHIIPASRGGTNDLDNLGICTTEANRAKHDKTPEEFIKLCQKVVDFNSF